MKKIFAAAMSGFISLPVPGNAEPADHGGFKFYSVLAARIFVAAETCPLPVNQYALDSALAEMILDSGTALVARMTYSEAKQFAKNLAESTGNELSQEELEKNCKLVKGYYLTISDR